MFEKHKFEFHGETYCGCCERNYEDFKKYFQHLKHVCVICQKKFKSNDSFACHLRNFHSNKPRKKLRSEEGSEEENFSCGLCQERHSSREELVKHVNSRHPARVSVNTGGIVKDERKAGGSGESVNTCSLCFKVFYQPKQPKPKAGQETGTSTSKQNAKKNSSGKPQICLLCVWT